MKAWFFILFSCIVGTGLHAQDRYVEVLVTDTMRVNPTKWRVVVKLSPRYEGFADSAVLNLDTVAYPGNKPQPSIDMQEIRNLMITYGGAEARRGGGR